MPEKKTEQMEKEQEQKAETMPGTGNPAEAEASIKDLEAAVAAAKEEAAKNYDHYVRARADLENYRKRAQREKEDLARFANENLIREILPVLDNLERALDHATSDDAEMKGLLEGVQMTVSQFQKALEKFGVTLVVSHGKPFDPAHHEAMGQIESTEHPSNMVAQELQKGYLLNDRLLRPALVMVTKAVEKKEQ